MKTPLLIISDAPSTPSGLSRICKDIALGIHYNLSDIYEVATLGYKGNGDRRLPFMQYNIEGLNDWFVPGLHDVWENFAGNRKGAVLCIWDASRLLWFARPDNRVWSPDREMREWLMTRPFQKWIYAPMDAEGPNGRLCDANAECLYGFDRIIAYSEWAKHTITETFGDYDCDSRKLVAIPHGIHTSIFHPHLEANKRNVFQQELGYAGPPIDPKEHIIGIVATNQLRKDYGMAIAALAEVAKEFPIRIYIQIDALVLNWSLPKLLMDYSLLDRVIKVNTSVVSDQVMAKMYSACDLTLGIGPEGFGFPIFESLACGTPVIAGNLGGHAEHMDPEFLLPPVATRLEGIFNSVRPVFDPTKWAYRIKKFLARNDKTGRFKLEKSLLPERLDWKNLWPNEWEPHLRSLHDSVDEEPIIVNAEAPARV